MEIKESKIINKIEEEKTIIKVEEPSDNFPEEK